MELDKLKELLGDAEKESIKKDIEIQKTNHYDCKQCTGKINFIISERDE